MAFASRGITGADILAELNKYLTNSTNKITDARALLIDHLDKDISAILSAPLATIDIWSAPAEIVLDAAAADKALPDVVIPDLGTYTIVKAYAMFSWQSLNNVGGGANAMNTAVFIQIDKAAAGYINAISTPANIITFSATIKQTAGQQGIGNLDISSRVENNATSNFKWDTVGATADSIVIGGFQVGIRLIVEA